MMVNVIPCPKCETPLMVPPGANGRRARCPACSHRFVISLNKDLLEDTVSNWIMKDVEEIFEGVEQTGYDHSRSTTSDPRDSYSGSSPQSTTTSPMSTGGGPVATVSHGLGDSTIIGVPVMSQSREGGQCEDSAGLAQTGKDHTHRMPLGSEPVASDDYPTLLKPDKDQPYLVVIKCSVAGVQFAFDSEWLKHEGFRASMPQRCVASGNSKLEQLIARPMVFIDRCHGAKPSLEEINSLHENRTIDGHSSRNIMQQMGVLEKLLSPFQYAMPYYVSTHHARLSLLCQTRNRSDDGVTCEVLVPDQRTALDWLANVNGVCGLEYELLEREVSMMHGESWRSLTELCRQRLTGWCKFSPNETFIMYVSDADFGRCDHGMAGVVVTDQRLILCKYHHRGQVCRDNKHATVYIKCDGMFAGLRILIGDGHSKTIKIFSHDVESLAKELRRSKGLDVIVC